MSKKSIAAQAAEEAAQGAAGTDTIEGKARQVFAEAEGVEWDDYNTEPAAKTFHLEIQLDAFDRIKLGLLAAKVNETPERWLEVQARYRFTTVCDEVFGYGRKADKPLRDSYEAFAEALGGCLAPLKGPARLTLKPAVMA